MRNFYSTALRYENTKLYILDQTLLPFQEHWVCVENHHHMIHLIQKLAVRGAPLIGVAAAFSLAQFAQANSDENFIRKAAGELRSARPTAVNLMWAIDRILSLPHLNAETILQSAFDIAEEDARMCEAMASHALDLIQDGDGILTVCNSGGLATAGLGTALGAILNAHKQGRKIHVYACETRPLLQGARLTAWELSQAGVSYTLICDSVAATLMKQGKITKCFVGADRIAANGDFANKIGTYALALAAKFHSIPFYAVAPRSTVDEHCDSGDCIPIEERGEEEVHGVRGSFGAVSWAAPGAKVFNPAFDVTPFSLVSGIILDSGIWS